LIGIFVCSNLRRLFPLSTMKTFFLFVVAQVIPSVAGKELCERPADPTHAPSPSQIVTNVTIPSGGIDRLFTVYVPPDANGPLPAVISWHGFNAHYPILDYQVQVTNVLDQAEKSKYVAIIPLGTFKSFAMFPQLDPFFPCNRSGLGRYGWNSIDGGLPGGAPGVDDELFTRDLLDYIKQSMRDTVDQSRVYMQGFSNGAFQALGASCQFPDSIAGVGATAGTMKLSFLDTCRDAPPVPVQLFHAINDDIIPYDNTFKIKHLVGVDTAQHLQPLGIHPERGLLRFLGLATQHQISKAWKHRNLCTGDEQIQITKNTSTTTCRRWNCPGAPVEVCTVYPNQNRPSGLAHCWIGGASDGAGYPSCIPEPGDVDATAHMFEFWDSLHQQDSLAVV